MLSQAGETLPWPGTGDVVGPTAFEVCIRAWDLCRGQRENFRKPENIEQGKACVLSMGQDLAILEDDWLDRCPCQKSPCFEGEQEVAIGCRPLHPTHICFYCSLSQPHNS